METPAVEPREWAEGPAALPDSLEATLPDGNAHILLLPAEITAQEALELLTARREPGDLPWIPGHWLECEDAAWVKTSAIVSLRIVSAAGPKTTTA